MLAPEGEAGRGSSSTLTAPGSQSARPAPTTRNPSRPYSAPRPLGEGEPPKSDVRERLKAEAANTALNGVAILREAWTDFRRSDRYFKYKALILAVWVLLSGTGFVVACPGAPERNTDFGAKLLVSDPGGRRVYLIKNEGTAVWKDVRVLVNGEFQLTSPQIDPGNDLVFGSKQLVGKNGKIAPENLAVRRLELRTSEGDAVMIEDGRQKE